MLINQRIIPFNNSYNFASDYAHRFYQIYACFKVHDIANTQLYKLYVTNQPNGCLYTVNRERFTGINIRGFSSMKFFMEILLRCIGHYWPLIIGHFCVHYLTKAKNSRENFCGKLKNHKTTNVQPSESFPVYGNYFKFTFTAKSYIHLLRRTSVSHIYVAHTVDHMCVHHH